LNCLKQGKASDQQVGNPRDQVFFFLSANATHTHKKKRLIVDVRANFILIKGNASHPKPAHMRKSPGQTKLQFDTSWKLASRQLK